MAKLRHIAMVAEDMDKTASFYEKSFGMKRVRETETAIGLTDGYMSMVIIHPTNINMKAGTKLGLHHIGFLIDDMDKTAATVEANGASYHGGILGSGTGPKGERKYLDPNGLMFDVTVAKHARSVWLIPVDETQESVA